MRTLTTNKEILEYYARKDIADILSKHVPKVKMIHSYEETIKRLIEGWKREGYHLLIIKKHRQNYRNIIKYNKDYLK